MRQDDFMDSVSTNTVQNAITKNHKIHRGQQIIARKVIAFQELTNLKQQKKSAREVANILEIPNSTMQSWRKQKASQKVPVELIEFLSTPVGADFLQRNVVSVMKLMKCGPSGIRGVQEYLRNSGLDNFVASSEGALHNFWARCETYILEFGRCEEKKLSMSMRHRKITAGLDEMFRSHRPCLVAIEVVSNYILLEKFTENRTAETWIGELKPRLNEMNVDLGQVVSDLCGAIRSCTKTLGATHIPELFHAQYEISKATSAPLASQERSAEIALNEEEKKVLIQDRIFRSCSRDEYRKEHQKFKEVVSERDTLKVDFEKKKKRREDVKRVIREMGKIHHPIDLQSGKLQTAAEIEGKFHKQLAMVREYAEEAQLSEKSLERIEKAKRAFDAIVCYVQHFFLVYAVFIGNLQINPEETCFFNDVIFPLCYLKMIWKRLSKKEQKEHEGLLKNLEIRARDAPWEEELKENWMNKGKELAETFQRSSSCVEGRNGVLSLNHHRFHRLNIRSLQVLTIVHNFDVRRSDGTTAAERFFEAKHKNLFDSLVMNVRIPDKPKQQYHDIKKRLLGREKRIAA